MTGGYGGQLAVPIWGRFMQQAGMKNAGWLRQPPGIVSMPICRESGALPVEACYRVERMESDGSLAERSMVATEYFRLGTEPTEHCTMHKYER